MDIHKMAADDFYSNRAIATLSKLRTCLQTTVDLAFIDYRQLPKYKEKELRAQEYLPTIPITYNIYNVQYYCMIGPGRTFTNQ
jgi:hypothetical protein